MRHSKSTDHTEYSLVIASGRVPFEKCTPILDKLIRFRVFKYVLLKSAHAGYQCGKFCLGWFWCVIERCHGSETLGCLANVEGQARRDKG